MEGMSSARREYEGEGDSAEQTIIDTVKKQRIEWFNNDLNDKVNEAIVDWFNAKREKYPDIRDYRLVHALIGSTPAPGTEKFDLPGEDSVQVFIQSLAEHVSKE
jgi:hypothetical protein